jgi:hypothetical protein
LNFDLTAEEIRSSGTYCRELKTPRSVYTEWSLEWNNRNVIAVIHEKDNEVASAFDARTYEFLYTHPTTARGFDRLGTL